MFSYLVLVQLGAIGALLAYFWRDYWQLVSALPARPLSSPQNRRAWLLLFATAPALLSGWLLRDAVQMLFGNPLLEAAIRFFTAAVALTLAESLGRQDRPLEAMTVLDSFVIGLFQILAVFPGASRSGVAIGGGMLRHLDRAGATRFAFLMSAPVMLAAGAYELLQVARTGALADIGLVLAVGLAAAAVTGWFSINWLITYVRGHRLYPFAAYCALAGIFSLVLQGT
jgi:undecaprenyl-diphosphatase